MESFLELMEKAVAKSGDPLGCYSPVAAKFLSLDTLIGSWRSLESARRKARRSAEYGRRVRRASLPVAYVVLARWDALREEAAKTGWAWPWPGRREDLLAWFLETARGEGVTMISEWQSLADWAAKGGRQK
jgi:hypothetical protein